MRDAIEHLKYYLKSGYTFRAQTDYSTLQHILKDLPLLCGLAGGAGRARRSGGLQRDEDCKEMRKKQRTKSAKQFALKPTV